MWRTRPVRNSTTSLGVWMICMIPGLRWKAGTPVSQHRGSRGSPLRPRSTSWFCLASACLILNCNACGDPSASVSVYGFLAGEGGMAVVGGVILEPHVVTLVIDEARLPVSRVHFRIMDGDDVFELVADFADAFEGAHLLAMRQSACIEEGHVREAGCFHHQRVAFPMPDRMAVVSGLADQAVECGQRLVQHDHA